jgi:hypothetical protein
MKHVVKRLADNFTGNGIAEVVPVPSALQDTKNVLPQRLVVGRRECREITWDQRPRQPESGRLVVELRYRRRISHDAVNPSINLRRRPPTKGQEVSPSLRKLSDSGEIGFHRYLSSIDVLLIHCHEVRLCVRLKCILVGTVSDGAPRGPALCGQRSDHDVDVTIGTPGSCVRLSVPRHGL